MIVYRLVCAAGHEFEGWFKDSGAFDVQAAKRRLECPICGDTQVQKAIMAPALARSSVSNEPVPAASPAPDPQKVRQFMAGYRKFIQENAEYVGPGFPEEARKIHYGEAGERHIYGESSLREARELIEEGIEIAAVPPDPGDLN